jgi:hypothetical protein
MIQLSESPHIYEEYCPLECSGAEVGKCLPQYTAEITVIFVVTAMRTHDVSI